MFGAAKPTGFGTAFGAGTTFGSSTPFGAATPASTSAFGTGAFGTQTPASGGLFGSASTASTGLFGQQNTFGQSTGFTFGSTPSTSGGLFGQNTQSSSVFSTPNTFGTTSGLGGFGTTNTGGLFGAQNTTMTSTSGPSIFGASVFGSSNVPNGTTVKFTPVTGTDSMVKNGLNTSISTKHQCITAMKEYEQKSLEELRVDDYIANRKGKQQSTLFGATPAGTSTGFGSFGQQSTTFGNATSFGATSAAPTSLFGSAQTAPTTGGLFGQPKPLFGATTTAPTSFGFGNTNTPSLFGQPAQTKSLFGTATTQASTGLFGNAGTSTFGNTSFNFANSTASTGGLFGAKPTGFGASTAPSLFGSTTSTGTSLFNKPFGTATSTTGFGNTTGGLFGAKTTGFGTAATSLGAGTTPFGSSLGTGFGTAAGTSLFGNQAKPTFGFGNPGSTFGSLGGGAPTTTTFSFGNQTTTALGGNMDTLVAAQQAQIQQQLAALTRSPYGDSPLFWNLQQTTTNREDILKPTNPAAQKAALSQYKVSARPSNKIKPKLLHPAINGNKSAVFDGTDDDDFCFGNSTFVPRKSIKKLVLRSRSPGNGQSPSINQDQNSYLPETNASYAITNGLTDRSDPKVGRDLDHRTTNGLPQVTVDQVNHVHSGSSLLRPLTPPGDATTAQQQREQQLDDTIVYYNPVPGGGINGDPLNESQLSQDLDHSEYPQNQDLPPHPTGIVMTRPGYYTVPTLDELTTMIDSNGDIFVENFTVGRYNYGSVYFPGVTNVAHLNIDDIVHFRRKEVIVYPDDENKPPEGEGLNKLAEVTLDCVWPRDKTSKAPISSPERLGLMKYAEKIELSTAKMGAKFIDYRPETGSWVFEVKHFSKYRLEDDSDEDEISEEEMDRLKRLQQQQQLQQKQSLIQTPAQSQIPSQPGLQIPSQSIAQIPSETHGQATNQERDEAMKLDVGGRPEAGDESVAEPMTDDEDEVITGLIEEEMGDSRDLSAVGDIDTMEQAIEPSSHRLATGLGLDPRNVQSMKASLFDDDVQPVGRDSGMPLRASQSDTSMSLGIAQKRHPDPQRPTLFSTTSLRQKYTTPSAARQSASLMDTSRDISQSDPFKARQRQPNLDHLVVPNGLIHEKAPTPRVVGMRTTHILPPVDQSVTYRAQHLLHDSGLFMGRSFRVGWGPGNTLVHSGQIIAQVTDEAVKQPFSILNGPALQTESLRSGGLWKVTIERVNVTPYVDYDEEAVLSNHNELLEIQLKHSDRHESYDDQCPLFTPTIGVAALHDFCASSDNHKSDTGPDSLTVEHMRMVWHLCVALWGNIPSFLYDDVAPKLRLMACYLSYSHRLHQDYQTRSTRVAATSAALRKGANIVDIINKSELTGRVYSHQQARREAFSEWLMMVSSKHVKEDISNNNSQGKSYLCTILALLSGGRIVDACVMAQRESDHRLALLIAQACGSDYPRQALAKQIMNWAEIGADEYISGDRLKIYAILASHLVWVASDKTVNCCETMDWKRALALHLWFLCKSNATITEALSEYDAAYVGDNPHGVYAVAPLPPYLEPKADLAAYTTDKKHDTLLKDTCYHLMKLYTVRSYSLDHLLCPVSSTANQLDYRLSWHLCGVLLSLGYTHISEQRLCAMHASYASQLECVGAWHWAVFVLMHIDHPNRRKQAVRDVLNRHVGLSSDAAYMKKEAFVKDRLGVPEAWIHYAKALHAKHTHLPEKEAWHLLKAGQWNASHRVIVKHIAPEAVINEDLDFLKSYLDELSAPERSCSIQNWLSGGGVYLDYIRLIESLDSIQRNEPNLYELERLEPRVTSLCSRVGSLKCHTAKQRLCQLEMSKKSANLLRTLMSLQHETSPEHVPVSLLAPHINNLPMSEDYSMLELRAHTNSLMIHQTA